MSFQNRLSHFQDKRNTRLVQNDISRSGIHTDAIYVTSFRDAQYDERRTRIEGFQFVPVVFPFEELEKMQTRLGTTEEGKTISFLSTEESMFEVYVNTGPRKKLLTKDDLLFWMVENFSGSTSDTLFEPTLLLLRVADIMSHFGSHGIIFHGYNCAVGDPSTLPPALLDSLAEAYEKRRSHLLASHARTQLEPPR